MGRSWWATISLKNNYPQTPTCQSIYKQTTARNLNPESNNATSNKNRKSKYQVSVGPVVMEADFGRTDPCPNPRNTLGRGMEPNHPELGLDPDVSRRVNRMQTPKKQKQKNSNIAC